jgi:hypothetical protein
VYASGPTEQVSWQIPDVAPIFSFGEDAQRELYVISGRGNVYRIARQ